MNQIQITKALDWISEFIHRQEHDASVDIERCKYGFCAGYLQIKTHNSIPVNVQNPEQVRITKIRDSINF